MGLRYSSRRGSRWQYTAFPGGWPWAYYVEEAQSGSTTEYKLYIMANGEPVAYVSDDGTPETRYLHKDKLGSITTIITNQNFAGREKLSYDVWGKRRHGTDWWSAPAAASEERGYTGHEHLDNVNLIHMNGRAYDPQLARFTSPDPYVPDPLYSQSYNRYAYVYNNPLKHTDPSGFLPRDECRAIMICKQPGPRGPWTDPVIPDPGFYFVQPGDYLYALLQEQMRIVEEYRVEAIRYNYLMSVSHPAAKTDQEGTKPQATIGGALWDIGAGLVLAGAGFVPGLGDSLDVYDVVNPNSTMTDRAIAGGSLAINAWTAGLAPNAGPIVRGGRRIGSGGADLWAVSKGFRDEAVDAAKSAWARAKQWASGCGCFVAGTLVATSMGLTPIEAIAVGDQVWARDEATGQVELKPVTALIRPPQRVIWKVTFEMDEGTSVDYAEFEVTDDHPWGAVDGTWVRTDELKPGVEILRAHGVPARVMSVVQTERTEQTYNLEVADSHTYFVGEARVWVHNARKCGLDEIPDGSPPPNMSPPGAGRQGAFNEAKRASGVPTSQQPARTLPNTDPRGNPQPGRVYEYDVPAPGGGTRTVRIRDDAAGHAYADDPTQNRGPHFNDEAGNHYDYPR